GPSNVSIDSPASGATVSAPFTIVWWALNSHNAVGAGVDAVHVWGFAADGSSRFLGVAERGISRPDVGAVFGTRYTASGFSLRVDSLPLGRYTIIAYAHNPVSGVF